MEGKVSFRTAIASLFLGLAGCGFANSVSGNGEPPQPPNCPELPDLAHITLEDGSYADVRIIQFSATKLFFPRDMLAGRFVDEDGGLDADLRELRAKQFNPSIYKVECPAVVHRVSSGKKYSSDGFLISDEVIRAGQFNFSNNEGVSRIGFLSIKNTRGEISTGWRGFRPDRRSEYTVVAFEDFYLTIELPKKYISNSIQWQVNRERIEEFLHWLATPPNQRDNSKKFEFGIQR